MTQNQIDFIQALRHVSDDLASYVEARISAGASFDEVQAQLRRAVQVVDGWRIGRGV